MIVVREEALLKRLRKVRWIGHPRLPGHPRHELAESRMKGFGAMLSFGLEGGFERGRRMMNAVKLCALAVSLGNVESLI